MRWRPIWSPMPPSEAKIYERERREVLLGRKSRLKTLRESGLNWSVLRLASVYGDVDGHLQSAPQLLGSCSAAGTGTPPSA